MSGIFSRYLLPFAVVNRKFPIVFNPPCEAGVICSIDAVEAIKIRRAISTCFRVQYLTTKAFLLLSDVGKKSALFLISANISRSFSLGIISSKDSKKTLRLKVSFLLFDKIICLHFVVFARSCKAVVGDYFLDNISTSSKTANSSNLSLIKQLCLIICKQF